MEIKSLLPQHWPQVKAIYESGIATGNATFETAAPEWEKWDAGHAPGCRFIAVEGQAVLGWAALSPVSVRKVYAGVAEVSIYIDEDRRGKGVGHRLLQALIEASEAHGFWTLQAGIFPENLASIHLHEKHGFRQIGYRERIGKMGDRWRNTVQMERRSAKVGV
jgi:L-amino acid N-acyltransferase YncA